MNRGYPRMTAPAALAVSFLLLLLGAGAAGAQGIEFSFLDARFNYGFIEGFPVPTGAGAELLVPLAVSPGTGNSGLLLSLRAAAGYEDRRVLRDDATGDPVAAPATLDGAHRFNWLNVEFEPGLVWRLSGRSPDGGGVSTELFASLRGRYETGWTSLGTSVFPDMRGMLGVSGIAGAAFDSTRTDSGYMKSGAAGEVSAEWAPGFANSMYGPTDFVRASARAEGYLPLLALGKGRPDSFSLYAAGFAVADWLQGSAVPLYVLSTFGGRDLRSGLGKSIRGFQQQGYDASVKVAASAELRAVGPAIFRVAGLRPMAYGFADGGWYSGLDRASPAWADTSGLVMSVGGGVALDVLDFLYLGARAGVRLPVADPLYAVYQGTGARPFFWGITLLMHF